MAVGRESICRLADLAALEVDREAADLLAREIAAIVEFVSQIDEVDAIAECCGSEGHRARSKLRLREDAPSAAERGIAPSEFAPQFKNGFFLAPSPELLGEE